MSAEWNELTPNVKADAEFLEIASDFGNPLEVLREAISNSFDANATEVWIEFVMDREDDDLLVIKIHDNGIGMTYEEISNNFWDLGNSSSKEKNGKIGEKGHGTKIYLRSEYIEVITHHEAGSYESCCENPWKKLSRGELHQPKIRKIDNEKGLRGTAIILGGYNKNERSSYVHDIIADYIYWYTKLGSFESEFEGKDKPNIAVYLKALGDDEFKKLEFGHRFAEENKDIKKLFEEHQENAVKHFVKKYVYTGKLEELPEINYEAVIYVEGDDAKKKYNNMIRTRAKKEKGQYKVADRYGIWLAKDYIPVYRANDWITGFGVGSNSFVLLHGFINCQDFKLTANRGSIANTKPAIISGIKKEVERMIADIDEDLKNREFFTLQEWQLESKTKRQEEADFSRRKDGILAKQYVEVNGHQLLVPSNEAELFGFFMMLYAYHPEVFPFMPLDYNTQRGIDMIARDQSGRGKGIRDCEYWYVELKYRLTKEFNHSFEFLRWVLCWDFDKAIKHDTEVTSNVDQTVCKVAFEKDAEDFDYYYLTLIGNPIRIGVIRLKDVVEKKLGLEIKQV
jgi:hypothetical protein